MTTTIDLSEMRRMMDEKRSEAMNDVDRAFQALQLEIPNAIRNSNYYVATLNLMLTYDSLVSANRVANDVVTKFNKYLDAGCVIKVNSGTCQREGDWCQLELWFSA